MLTNLTELDSLRVFAAIVEKGSFRAAADFLSVPRSTVSLRMATLEQSLDLQLLARSTRRVTVTDAGQDYYDRVRPALQLLEEANQRMTGLTAAPRGKVRVSASSGIGGALIAQIAQEMATRYPDVMLTVDITDRHVDLVREGYDAALRSGALKDSNLISTKIAEARLSCYASPQYLARSKPLRTPEDLSEHETISYTDKRTNTWMFTKPRDLSVKVSARYSINQYRMHVDAAARGLGVIRVLEFHAASAVTSGALVPVLTDWGSAPTNLYAVTQGTPHRTAALVAFLALAKEAARSMSFQVAKN